MFTQKIIIIIKRLQGKRKIITDKKHQTEIYIWKQKYCVTLYKNQNF